MEIVKIKKAHQTFTPANIYFLLDIKLHLHFQPYNIGSFVS